MSQVSASAFQSYNPSQAATITPGPLALYTVNVGSLDPTQQNEGFTEVGKKAAGFDLETPAQAQASLLTDIEPVVIGPGGQLYLTDGHHTFTALDDSIFGASNPTVYVNVIANYSNLTTTQFFAQLQASNLLLPLNDGVPETVNDANGAPLPTSLTGLNNDPYRGLEYSILKNKNSKLFTTTSNITGAVGTAIPGTDKMTGFYEDFLNAAAYRGANGGLGLPYLSPGDIALASQWTLNPNSATTLPNVAGTVKTTQLPGFILAQNLTETNVSNATLAGGALAGDGTFTGITQLNAGTAANPITIGTPNTGFIMQLGADKGFSVTLNGTNTYSGGTSILAGTLIASSDAALGAAATGATIDPTNLKASIQAANGIVFNSLTEGNGTLQLGTAAGGGTVTFSSNRAIAVGGEAATINLNGYLASLTGGLYSLGTNGVGLGNATGFSDLTIDDNSANNGVLTLSTPSPNFYGNLVIGNANSPTVRVTSDAALGATAASGAPAGEIGEVELNGGTLQAGASFNASDRNVFLGGGSTIDTAGFATTWGTLSDMQRTLTITNSNTATAGSATFANFTVDSTATLALKGAETTTFSGGILRSGPATLVIQPTAGALGATETVTSGTGAASVVDGIAPAWMVTNNGTGAGPYDFLTYGANGYVAATYGATALSGTTGASAVKLGAAQTATGNLAAYALNTNGKVLTLGGNTLTIGDGTAADAAGLILAAGSAITGGTLAFGGSEGVIWSSGTNATISSAITGSAGLTFAGAGGVTLSAAANVSGPITIGTGTVTLAAANVFAGDESGVLLQNTKKTPAPAALSITANNTVAALNSVGGNSTVSISGGAKLTIGDATNQSSSLSSTITETGAGVAGAITKAGSGLLDLSGGKLTLAAGGSVAVTGGALRVAVGTSATANYVLSNGADLQFAQNGGGQYSGAVTGAGTLHLIGGTLQLTGTANSYSGGTIVETGSILDTTTANLSSTNQNITDAGGLVVFDQATAGTYSGVISDGQELGTGPTMQGSFVKDDSTGGNGGNVTMTAVQTYTGATAVEAGTLTLGAANAIASSSGVVLGRVGGSATAATGITATLALGADQSLASLSNDAGNSTAVTLNGHTLTLNAAAGSVSSFGGTVADGSAAGQLVKAGAGALVLSGANSFTGGTTLSGGTLELASQDAAGLAASGGGTPGAVAFAGTGSTLRIDAGALSGTTYAGAVTGFAQGDAIDLSGLAYQSDDRVTLSGTALTVGDANGTESLTSIAAAAGTNAGYGFMASSDGTGGTLVTLVAGPPQASSTNLTVAENAGATPIGLAAPTDPSFAAGQLTITVGSLPSDGIVALGNGTPVTSGQVLSAAQLTSLTFTPTMGASARTSSFTYTVTDPNGNTATGTAALAIGAPGAPGITGTHATTTKAEAAVKPFTGVTVSDPSTATETLTIALSGGGGTLAGATRTGASTYSLTGTAAQVTAALDALTFTPAAPAPGSSATTTFVLTDASSTGTSVTNGGTSVTDTAAAPVDAVSIDANANFIGHGTFVLTGTASSTAGVKSVEISAQVDGVATDLGAATLNGDGTFIFKDHVGAHIQGFITATETDAIGGTTSSSPPFDLVAGIRGESYQARQDTYTPDGSAVVSVAYEQANGYRTVDVEAFGQTLQSQFHDTFANGGQGGSTFVFTPGYGSDEITEFRPRGPAHDTIELPSSDFTSFADVLRHTENTATGAIIHDPTSGDTLMIANFSKAQLAHNKQDVAFHA